MTTIRLIQTAGATFDANGVAQVELRNNKLTTWETELLNTTTTSELRTQCTVYRGEASPQNQIDFTQLGNGDTSDTKTRILPGEWLTIRWTGGTPGAFATFRIEGDEILRGRRAY